MKGLRKAYRGERGFTLVELLVVVVILGVLAAVATLAVTKFIGSGNVQAANTEMHNAKTAVAACMYQANSSSLTTASVTNGWAGDNTTNACPSAIGTGTGTTSWACEFVNGAFKATYKFDVNGTLISAVNGGANGSWSGLKTPFDPAKGWEKG